MDKELKENWVKALRSGRYKQAKRWLKDGRAYCCLGVLAKVSGCKFRHGEPYLNKENVGNGGGSPSFLDARVFGLPIKAQRALARKNDDGEKFDQIADYIERRL